MTAQPSTIRASAGQTVEDRAYCSASIAANARILDYWQNQHEPSVLKTIEEFPSLVENKTLLLDLALDEYKRQRQESTPGRKNEFCQKFQSLGSSLEHSIFRALEVQDYLDEHPELLRLVNDFQWPTEGEDLQGFQVVEELGRGALARVYLCHETGLGRRHVVVKIARGGDYEAAVLGRLDHPNIMPVYSVANDAARCASYICMPFRGRSTLQDVVDRVCKSGLPHEATSILQAARVWHPQSEWRHEPSAADAGESRGSYIDGVLRIAIEISGALAHAHAHGVLHGDLKPSNVLLTPSAQPLLIDFNLAKDRRAEGGPRGGTLAYMPPEQICEIVDCSPLQQASTYDVRSEIFSFGAMVYQLLAGKTPFQVSADVTDPIEAANSLLAAQKSHPPQLRTINSHVNAELEKLVQDCLALNPAHRPQTMHELEGRLRAQSRPAARVRRMVRARPLWAMLFSCAFLAASAGVAAVYMTRPPYQARQVARGIAFQNDGQYQDALECFGRALESDPNDKRALFEQSRTYLMLNNLLAASTGFTRLAIESGDLASAAYTGYCFNLKHEPGAAIAWYRRALDSGYETIGLCNNLGISYALGRSTLGELERFDAAQHFLNRAVELDARSMTVRANLVTLAIMRYDRDPNCELKPAVKHLEVLLAAMPHDPRVMTGAVQLYSVLSLRDEAYVGKAMEAIKSSIRAGNGPTAQDLSKTRAFESLRRDPRFDEIILTAGGAKSPTRSTLTTFIDPVGTGDKAVRVR